MKEGIIVRSYLRLNPPSTDVWIHDQEFVRGNNKRHRELFVKATSLFTVASILSWMITRRRMRTLIQLLDIFIQITVEGIFLANKREFCRVIVNFFPPPPSD